MYSSCTIGVNGAISFTETNISFANDLSSTSSGKINMIAPLWDDLQLFAANNGWIAYETTGTAPNRIFKVEWKNISHFGSSQSDGTKHVSFMLKLHETSNKIVFVYGHNTATLMGASIGLNAYDSTHTTFYSITPGSPATISNTTANNDIPYTEFPPNPKTYTLSFDGAYNDYNFNALPIIALISPRSFIIPHNYANNINASDSGGNTPACANFQGGDVWFKFTAPSTGAVNFVATNTFSSGSTLGFATYHNSYNSTVDYCGYVSSIHTGERNLIKDLVPGDTYYLRIWDYGDDDIGQSGGFYLTDNNTNGIEDYQALSFEFFPNPATDIVNVKSQTNIDLITLTNLIGQQVMRVTPQTQDTRLQIGSLEQGVYLMTVKTDDKMTTVKIVKK